ncbi:protein kinase [Arenimonas sp.]|uniref:serine/threonine-protein kinase n=1 Tax=Arenimonas sp. TaxID=1872635 RepID=UPI0035B29DDB
MGGSTDDDLAATEGLPTRAGPGGPAADGAALAPGSLLGRYRVEELLGRGGMGEVYRAGQLEPVRRTVAIKLLHARRLDARLLAYFEVERQMLAQMKHPAIAQVYDAGATSEGYPYFVMEFIEGSPLTSFCEDRRLPLRERIELFIRVCEGVQHAHQKGVIHRDLKPGNILVTEVDGRPLPKIIDFGIATAARRSLVVGERAGELERAGTPDYMSPEQAGLEGVEVDTRSDVYSLGVLLYELLAGRRPGVGDDTAGAQHTADTTVRPPSAQIETLAPGNSAARASQLGLSRPRLRKVLRSELDWVVLKAMRHDRADRYSSAAELAQELRRFLDDLPLQAVPPRRRYVLGKYLRRNRLAFAAAAAVSVAVLAGLGLSLYGLQQAREQRTLAQQRSADLERVAAFQQAMLEDIDIEAMGVELAGGLREQLIAAEPSRAGDVGRMLAQASPTDLARRLLANQLLAGAERAIDRDFAGQPLLAADLRESVGDIYAALALHAEAEQAFQAVADRREAGLGARDPKTLDARRKQLASQANRGDLAGALAALEALAPALAGMDPAAELPVQLELNIAGTMASLGRLQEARERQQALYDRLLAARGADDPQSMSVLNNLAISHARTGDQPRARSILEDLYPRRARLLGAEHDDTLATMANLAILRVMSGDIDAALSLQRELAEVHARKLGREHPSTLDQRSNLANMINDLAGREDDPALRAEAIAVTREVLEARARVLGPDSRDVLRSRLNLSAMLARDEQYDEALALEREVIGGRRALLGPEHPDTLFVEVNHLGTLLKAGREDLSLAGLPALKPRVLAVLGEKHPQTHALFRVEAELLAGLGRHEAARNAYAESYRMRREALGERHPETYVAAWHLAEAERSAGNAAAAEALHAAVIAPLLATPEQELDPGQRSAATRIRRAMAGEDD